MTGRMRGAAMAAMVTAIVLSGCVGDDDAAEPSASPIEPSASAEPSASLAPSATPEPSPSAPAEQPDAAALVAVPLGVGCDVLVSPQALYDFNPNVGTDPAFDPGAWALAPVAAQLQGSACGYLNQTSGERIAVSAARVAPESVAALAEQVASRGAAFRTAGATSTLEVLAGDRWIVVEAPSFFGEGDLQPLADAARASTGG
ncbi:hypothetical protein OVN20_08345 [Microcella daejeonensis]|uniref:hypothetical protein n=1 Tax=Microcella daejeonensis TaxID=2994971 RepID=UPI00227010BA|nr:hypothetical protein [Microcella daejeonensis]WAB83106.1 hypothetical protein OVN20_08345 [Microcella daejeonensis]